MQSVDASVLVDSDKARDCHCGGRMLLCTLKIRPFRVESKGFHIINAASDRPYNQKGQLSFYLSKVKVKKRPSEVSQALNSQLNNLCAHVFVCLMKGRAWFACAVCSTTLCAA